jgi:formate hydrogenlyase subunit 6/NADH:ubiquinone oxidoreductase subunit I
MEECALPHINLEQCTQCGTCVEECPSHAVEMTADGPSFVRPLHCTYCAVCEDVCPQSAITCTYVIVWEPQNAG